jgi:malate dehydrogenase (quinone)
MLRALEQLMPARLNAEEARSKLKAIFPEDNLEILANDAERYREIRDGVNHSLGIV